MPTGSTTSSPRRWTSRSSGPRALFERFNIEAISTTDSAIDDLGFHRQILASGWKGRVLPAYRPDAVVDPERAGFHDGVERLAGDDRPACDLGRLPRGPSRAPRLFQVPRRHFDRPRPCQRAYSRYRGSGSRSAVLPRSRRPGLAGRCRALPRPDAHRDGAHEPRRRAGDADSPRFLSQPQSRGSSSASAPISAPTSRSPWITSAPSSPCSTPSATSRA